MLKKLYVCLFGGLGNQLFQYAYARNLQIKYKLNLVIDNKIGFLFDFRDKRKFELKKVSKKISKKIIFFFLYYKIYKKIFRYKKKIFTIFNKKLFDETNCKSFKKEFLKFKKNHILYLHGFFQSEKYFIENKHIIIKEIMPRRSRNKLFSNLISKMNNQKSVAICIRLFNELSSVDLKKIGGKLNSDFYIKSIRFFRRKIKKPHFYIFTNNENNEISKLLHKMKINKSDYTFVTPQRGFKNSYDTLWLLSFFKFQLISNSTFYWWGAYFAKHRLGKVFIKHPKNFSNKDTVSKNLF